MTLERGVKTVHVQLVFQIKEQRGHADAEHDRRPQRHLLCRPGRFVFLAHQYHQCGETHDARGQTAEKQIYGNLPAPYRQPRVDLRIAARGYQDFLDHDLDLPAYSRT